PRAAEPNAAAAPADATMKAPRPGPIARAMFQVTEDSATAWLRSALGTRAGTIVIWVGELNPDEMPSSAEVRSTATTPGLPRNPTIAIQAASPPVLAADRILLAMSSIRRLTRSDSAPA